MNKKSLGRIAGAILLAIGLGAIILPKHYLASSIATCDSWYPINAIAAIRDGEYNSKSYTERLHNNVKCKQSVRDGKTLFTLLSKSTSIKDPTCETESYDVQKVCYFKKALELNEPRYCENLIARDTCLYYLATLKKDASLCELVGSPYNQTCAPTVETCKQDPTASRCTLPSEFRCPWAYEDDYEHKQKTSRDCVATYGKEYEGFPLTY